MSVAVLHLSTQRFPLTGGITEVLSNLLPGLAGCGYRMFLATEFFPGETPSMNRYESVPLKKLPSYAMVENDRLGYERLLDLNLRVLQARFKYSVIHAHWAYMAGYAAVLFGKRKGVPVVISCHGLDLAVNRELEGDIREKTELALRQAEAVIVPSKGLYRLARQIRGSDDGLHLIPHGVRRPGDQLPVSGVGGNPVKKPYILAVGHFDRVKGFDLLIKAFELIADEIEPVKLVVVSGTGRGVHDIFGFSLADRLKGRVIFQHRRSHERILELIKRAELLALPSREEGFGIVVLEAMAAGTAVVAFNVGVAADIICDGQNGLLVEKQDYRQLARAIKRVLNDAKLAGYLADNALETVKRYGWSTVIPQYNRVYQGIMNKPGEKDYADF
ncbi:MAG: glycosyltransferase family 4 protein [bacterium]